MTKRHLHLGLLLVTLFFSVSTAYGQRVPRAYSAEGADGTKGTIGFVCVNLEGQRIQWLANIATKPEPPKEFTGCMEEVLKHFKALRELENGEDWGKKMNQWFMTAYKSYVTVGEQLGCQRDLKEEWKRKILEESTPSPAATEPKKAEDPKR